MRLRFQRNRWLDEFHGNGLHFGDGDTQEVPDSEAQALLRDFPENFTAEPMKPAGDRAFDAPPKDRQFKRGPGGRGRMK